MRKIHITEAQLNELKQRLEEAFNVDATKDTEAAGGNVKTAWDNIKSKNPALSQQADNGEVNLSVNPTGIDEGKSYTKRQINEAKLKNLRENSVMFKKSDIR